MKFNIWTVYIIPESIYITYINTLNLRKSSNFAWSRNKDVISLNYFLFIYPFVIKCLIISFCNDIITVPSKLHSYFTQKPVFSHLDYTTAILWEKIWQNFNFYAIFCKKSIDMKIIGLIFYLFSLYQKSAPWHIYLTDSRYFTEIIRNITFTVTIVDSTQWHSLPRLFRGIGGLIFFNFLEPLRNHQKSCSGNFGHAFNGRILYYITASRQNKI